MQHPPQPSRWFVGPANDIPAIHHQGETFNFHANVVLVPPSSVAIFIVYAALFALLALQARGIAKSVVALRRGRIRRGRIGPWWRIGPSLVVSLFWALVVLVLVPKQLGLPLSVVATGFPDLVYLLLGSALVALGWVVVKAVWTYAALRRERAAQVAAT
jgi:hypothetical protein